MTAQRIDFYTGTRRLTSDRQYEAVWLECDGKKLVPQFGGVELLEAFDWGNQRPDSKGVIVLASTILFCCCGAEISRAYWDRLARIAAYEFDRWGFTITSVEVRRLVRNWELQAKCEGK